MEGDVAGWLFDLLLTEPAVDPLAVHGQARVVGGGDRDKYDIAVGPVVETAKRPAVRAEAVVEMKVFPRIGFGTDQHSVHYTQLLGDVARLGTLGAVVPVCAVVVIDGCRYLQGKPLGVQRHERLVVTRNEEAPGTHIFVLSLVEGVWQTMYDAPRCAGGGMLPLTKSS